MLKEEALERFREKKINSADGGADSERGTYNYKCVANCGLTCGPRNLTELVSGLSEEFYDIAGNANN